LGKGAQLEAQVRCISYKCRMVGTGKVCYIQVQDGRHR
jgi:hypothetical protein